MGYLGNRPAESYASFEKQVFTIVNSQTAYTLSHSVVNENDIRLVVNNVVQEPGSGKAYTASGTSLTLSAALVNGTDTMYAVFLGKAVQTINPPAASVGTSQLASEAVTPAKLGYDYNQYRNLVINGDMQIAQRATSTASITGNGYHTIDRFNLINTTLGTWTQSQDTDVPSGYGFAKSLKMDCTTADASPASGDRLDIQQKFEGQNLQHLKKGTSSAESLTLSFWVKATKTGTNIVELWDSDNTRQISQSYTISSSDTWEKKTLTFAGDTTGALGNDNGNSLQVSWWLGAGTDYTSGTLSTSWTANTNANRAVGQVNHADSTSNNFWITGVQLEVGTAASDFEFVPYDVNLQRCKRYFQNVDGAINAHQTADTSQAIFYFALQSPMRANPSATITNTTANFGTFGGNNDASSPSILSNKCTTTYGSLEYEHGVAFASSSGENQILIYNDHGTTFFTLSSEL